ncbi:MAG: right-handed parallel beta-helix repeat-containing protein [Methylocella sp.]
MNNLIKLAGMVVLGTGVAQATTIPATISTTLTIMTDSHLTGNVLCMVTGAPCIKFGAKDITLKLNGFIMTGNGGQTSCTSNISENGIDTNFKNNVSIFGPGLVRRFNGTGIVVSGNNSMVEGIAMRSSCGPAIEVVGSDNEIEGNSIGRAALPTIGPAAAIFVGNPGGRNRILNNEIVGASSSGIGVVGSNNNLIDGNNASGNSFDGIRFFSGSTRNTVRHNQALGNFSDIVDDNALGANDYDNNLCEVSAIGPSSVNICKLPNIAGHQNGPVDRN